MAALLPQELAVSYMWNVPWMSHTSTVRPISKCNLSFYTTEKVFKIVVWQPVNIS
jgi:hypothetical protein